MHPKAVASALRPNPASNLGSSVQCLLTWGPLVAAKYAAAQCSASNSQARWRISTSAPAVSAACPPAPALPARFITFGATSVSQRNRVASTPCTCGAAAADPDVASTSAASRRSAAKQASWQASSRILPRACGRQWRRCAGLWKGC